MDIDIDFKPSFDPATIFPKIVTGSMIKNNQLVKHPCGVYFQTIPVDNITKLSAIPYEEAEVLGYFKIDFLHLQLLEQVKSKQEIRELIKKEPNWDLLENEQVFSNLFQISKQYDIVNKIKPRTVQELADVIAIIRPNKRKYLSQYLQNKDKTRPLLYRLISDDKSSYKKSHAVAYALTIVLQLHMFEQQLNNL